MLCSLCIIVTICLECTVRIVKQLVQMHYLGREESVMVDWFYYFEFFSKNLKSRVFFAHNLHHLGEG